jgi:tetratricopeptide (TPR) repeat protein
MDVEDIAPGQRFAQTIDDTLARCDLALIVIGPRWAEALRQRAREQQFDYVCHEIEAVLARQIRIVPVLVGGATINELAGLPDRISGLSQYEAAELRDSAFTEDCARLAKSLGLQPATAAGESGRGTRTRTKLAIGLGSVLLVALLVLASGMLGIGPWREYRARKSAVSRMFATAKTQAERAENDTAFKTYQDLLATDPENRTAMDGQVDAAMAWLEDFHVIAPEGGSPEKLAAARLDEILPVLDAGLARTNGKGERAADILAHLGWAHWLNQKLAEREFGPAAKQDLDRALQIDPSNVFAHAMLGNWLMQNGGNVTEALAHFRAAVATNKARPLVREMQLGVLVYPNDRETRVALIRLADEMRRNGEAIDDHTRSRILSSYSPTVNSGEELSATLSAVPPADAWATYLWLNSPPVNGSSDKYKQVQNDFIHACILEIGGDRGAALAAFQTLRSELNKEGYNGRIVTHVNDAIARLSAH